HLTIGNYENEDGYYEAQMDKLLALIESVEMEIKPRLLRLRKLEFKCMWKIRYKELESYLRKRKERILSSNQPLILMELYFNLANIGEDDRNTLMNTLDCYKSEGLIKKFAIKEIA
ncbi:5766_t:CDS:1, partial [Acaulospora morrowiae]